MGEDLEEKFNAWSHGAGAALAGVGALMLLRAALRAGDPAMLMSFAIYGLALVGLYAASSLYHAAPDGRLKGALRKLDHVAIYFLIAGSYTPIGALGFPEGLARPMLGLVWFLAAVGVAQELTVGRSCPTRWRSLAIYLLQGAVAFLFLEALFWALPVAAFALLLGSGFFYLAGVYFYVNDHRRLFHGIWHLMVVAGSLCHFGCVWVSFA